MDGIYSTGLQEGDKYSMHNILVRKKSGEWTT